MLAGPRATEEVGLATAAVLVGIKCRQGTGASCGNLGFQRKRESSVPPWAVLARSVPKDLHGCFLLTRFRGEVGSILVVAWETGRRPACLET